MIIENHQDRWLRKLDMEGKRICLASRRDMDKAKRIAVVTPSLFVVRP